MQIRAHQTLASLFLSLQTSVTIISRHNPKTQAKYDRQEFKHWECMRVNVNLYFWSLRPHRRDSSKNHQERNNCRRVSGQMTVSFNSWQLLPPPPPPSPPPPGAGLIVGRLQSISEIDWTVSASLKNVLHSTSIVKQAKEGFHVRSTNIILNVVPCFSACHNWTYLTPCKTGYNKFADAITWGKQTIKYNMINKCSE